MRPYVVAADGTATERGLTMLYPHDVNLSSLPLNRPDALPKRTGAADYLVQECQHDGRVAWYFVRDNLGILKRVSPIRYGPYRTEDHVYFQIVR